MKQKVKEIREGRRKLEIARALEREVRPKWYERMAWSLTPPYTILVVGFLLIGGLAALKRWEWVGRLQSGQLLLLAAFSGIGFFSIVSSNLAWDENKAAGPLVFLFAWSVLGSLKSVAEKAKEYRGTKMRQWHSGKIALLWIASFIWMAMLYGPVRSEIHYYPWSYNGWTSGDLGIAILFAAPPIAALVLTWLWLTGREKKPTKLRAYPER